MDSITLARPWSHGEKITFRFLFTYFLLYTFPFGIGMIPFTWDWEFSSALWTPLIEWTAENILSLDYSITVLPNGSGDTTWNYVQVFVFALLSTFSTLIWSSLDWKSSGYPKLFFWLTILIRYYLAMTLIGYGFIKIIKTQFPFPSLERLDQTFGQASPMGLLWTFMGFSKAYNFFMGVSEALGGFLVFFRRTKTLGALIQVAVMSNVVILNFTYDVPVKLFSLHLLVMAIYLLAPDAKRLIQFFILNQQTSPVPMESVFKERNWKLGHAIVKGIFISILLVSQVVMLLQAQRQWGNSDIIPPLYGIYEVELHIAQGDTLPSLPDETRRWKQFIVNRSEWVSLKYMDSGTIQWRFSADTLLHKMEIMTPDSSTHYRFRYRREENLFLLKGELNGDSVHVNMRRRNPGDFLLVTRGFHWINEYPFNR